MDRDALKKDIEEVVANIWSEKEEAEVRKRTEEALQKSADTITELTNSLEEKSNEVVEAEEKASEYEAKIQELETELEAARKELEEANTKLAETENRIEEMKKDKAAELRMSELEEAGVAHSDKEKQTAKIREMSDEDFVAYKEELASLRKAVEAELEKTRKSQEEAEAKKAEEEANKAEEEAKKAEKEGEEEASEEGEEGEEEASEEDDETPPAELNPSYAAYAAMNFETGPSKNSDKYKELGSTLAKLWTKNDR
jgi:chromosome segregation ATPase